MTENGSSSIHATGQPDTPVEVLVDVLGKATKEQDLKTLRALVDQAYRIVNGLDSYLGRISTPPSPVYCL